MTPMFSFRRTARRGILAAGVAAVLATAAVGAVAAQQTPTPTPGTPGQSGQARPTHQAFLDALARRLGITTDRLQQAITEARTEVGLPDRAMGKGFGFRGPGKLGRGGVELNAAAQALGISVDQLRQQLPGKSLAQVAQANGKDPAAVAAALKDAANQRIDQAVAAGRLTADQATQLKQRAAQAIDAGMDKVVPQRGLRRGGREGHERSETPDSAPTPATGQGA